MGRVHSKNTTTEMNVRRRLHAAGFRYRLHAAKLPGKPDIVFPSRRLVVFVHGCLWHWHGCKRSRMPAANRAYWEKKISGNVERDAVHASALGQAGWRVEAIWECEWQSGVERILSLLRGTA